MPPNCSWGSVASLGMIFRLISEGWRPPASPLMTLRRVYGRLAAQRSLQTDPGRTGDPVAEEVRVGCENEYHEKSTLHHRAVLVIIMLGKLVDSL